MSLFGGIALPGRPDLENVRKLDLLPIPMILNMQRVGVAIDLPYLAELESEISGELDSLRKDISSYVPKDKLEMFCSRAAAVEAEEGDSDINPDSAVQIRVLLFDLLGIGRKRRLRLTDTGLVSTGKKQLDECRDDHPVVPLVAKYRERAKLKHTYCQTLPRYAVLHPAGPSCPICELPHVAPTRRIHAEVMTTSAATGRLAMKKGLHQIPIRTALGRKVRRSFIASPGKRLVSCDWSQMELRDLAHLARAESMLSVYRAGGDIHVNTAMKTFGIIDEKLIDKMKHRNPAKRTNYGIQNGIAGPGLHAQLVGDHVAADMPIPSWLTPDWCTSYIQDWHGIYPEVAPYFETQWYRARRYGFVWTWSGRVRRVPEVRSFHKYMQSAGMRQAQNLPITGSNADQLKLVMGELDGLYTGMRESGIDVWPVLSIHDQVVAEVEELYAEVVGELTAQSFRTVMYDKDTGEDLWPDCPIESDCEILERWEKAA